MKSLVQSVTPAATSTPDVIAKISPHSSAYATADVQAINDPAPDHPKYEVLGDLGLPTISWALGAVRPKCRAYTSLDAGKQGLSLLGLNQCQDVAQLQTLLVRDLADGVSYLDAFDPQAMEERSYVFADIAHKQAELLNTHLKLFSAETTKLKLAAQMIESVNCAALVDACDDDGNLKNMGLRDDQYELLGPLLAAPQDTESVANLKLADVYSRLALRYTAYEQELSQVTQAYLKAKQQAGRLAFYVACLQMLSGRATQMAKGIDNEQLGHASAQMSAEQANEARSGVSHQLRKLAKAPLVQALKHF